MQVLTRRPRRLALVLLAGPVVAGCSATAHINPKLDPPAAESGSIPRSVGVYYSPAFSGHHVRMNPATAGMTGTLDIPVGAASKSLLRQVFARLFADVEEIGHLPVPARRLAHLDAVIEPRIETFSLHAMDAGGLRYWAKIRYRLRIRDPDGRETASWTVLGTGTSEPRDAPSVRPKSLEQTIEHTMSDAAAALMRSFEEVPEAVRWLNGRPPESTTAPASDQIGRARSGSAGNEVHGSYPSLVAVTADPDRSPDFAGEGIEPGDPNGGSLSIYVHVENLGERRLLVDPRTVTVKLRDGAKVETVSGSYLAAVTAATQGGAQTFTPPPAADVGAAVVNLIFAIQYYSAYESRTAVSNVVRLVYEKDELEKTILEGRRRVEGFVHFNVPRSLIARREAVLYVPVVDLDTVTRYVVALPLGPPGGVVERKAGI